MTTTELKVRRWVWLHRIRGKHGFVLLFWAITTLCVSFLVISAVGDVWINQTLTDLDRAVLTIGGLWLILCMLAAFLVLA